MYYNLYNIIMDCVGCESKDPNAFVPCKSPHNNKCISCKCCLDVKTLNKPFCVQCAQKTRIVQIFRTILRYIYVSPRGTFMCDHDTATNYVNVACKIHTTDKDCEPGVWFKPLCATKWVQRGLNHIDLEP